VAGGVECDGLDLRQDAPKPASVCRVGFASCDDGVGHCTLGDPRGGLVDQLLEVVGCLAVVTSRR
jgi:hypothetical protein